MIQTIHFETQARHDWVDLTEKVNAHLRDSGIREGLVLVFNPHSTGGLFLNSFWDPNTPKDIMHEIDRLIPTRFDFFHQNDTPSDAAGHVKSALLGSQLMLILHEGTLMVGHSQGILFAEFDGPRKRHVIVKILAEG